MPAIFSEKGIAECRLTLQQLATSWRLILYDIFQVLEAFGGRIQYYTLCSTVAVWSKYER